MTVARQGLVVRGRSSLGAADVVRHGQSRRVELGLGWVRQTGSGQSWPVQSGLGGVRQSGHGAQGWSRQCSSGCGIVSARPGLAAKAGSAWVRRVSVRQGVVGPGMAGGGSL